MIYVKHNSANIKELKMPESSKSLNKLSIYAFSALFSLLPAVALAQSANVLQAGWAKISAQNSIWWFVITGGFGLALLLAVANAISSWMKGEVGNIFKDVVLPIVVAAILTFLWTDIGNAVISAVSTGT